MAASQEQLGVFVQAYNLINLLIQQDKIADRKDLLAAVMLVCWTLHLMPGVVSLSAAFASFEFLKGQYALDQPIDCQQWLLLSAMFDLLTAVELIELVDVGPELIQTWTWFFTEVGMGTIAEVNANRAALAAIAQAAPEYGELIGPITSHFDPEVFISKEFGILDNPRNWAIWPIFKHIPPSPLFG
jgi:hypothetical protein